MVDCVTGVAVGAVVDMREMGRTSIIDLVLKPKLTLLETARITLEAILLFLSVVSL